VSVQFPRSSINDVLAIYEVLTGRHLIRDSKLDGPELTISVPGKIPKQEAIRIIEAAMLLNGYTLLPVDDTTSKILGPSRPAQAEGIPLFVDVSQLPQGDQVVSFFMSLEFISPEDAESTFSSFVKFNSFGSVIAVPNAGAVVVTEKTSVIRRLLALQRLIDVPPAQVTTKFVQLKRADAERVVEILDKLFKTDSSARTTSTNNAAAAEAARQQANIPLPPGVTRPPVPTAVGGGAVQYEKRMLSGEAQFAADPRTNRILVVTRKEDFTYISTVIEQLDAAVEFDQPLERPLRYVKASEVLPVLANMIAETSEDQKENQADSSTSQGQQSLVNGGSSGGGLGGGTSGGGFPGSNSGSSSSSSTTQDKLRDPEDNTAPLSRIVGKTRLIADVASNSIVVIGPPESREKVRSLLDILDRKPMQVYLSTVVGQLRLGDGINYGVDYLVKYTPFSTGSSSGIAGTLLNSTQGAQSVIPNPTSLVANDAFSALSGLTLYGVIADSVNVYARALESSNRFRTLSRPVVYTTNNKKAVILSGQQVPVASSVLTSTTPGITGSSINANVEYKDIVLKLEVVPLINSEKEVTLVISQRNDNIIGQQVVSGNSYPIVGTQEVTTTVTLKNGNTVVLGGLITEEKTNDRQGIPYLNRLPIVGGLFGDVNKNRTRNELIVLIQPTVVGSENDALRESWDERSRSALGDEAMELAQPQPTPGKKGKPFVRP